jgi:hypothetical protein
VNAKDHLDKVEEVLAVEPKIGEAVGPHWQRATVAARHATMAMVEAVRELQAVTEEVRVAYLDRIR